MSTNRTTTASPPAGTAAPADGSPRHPFPYGPDREPWTPRATPGPAECTRCGATTIDVQGGADCPECAHVEVTVPE